jgi:dTMP kinase
LREVLLHAEGTTMSALMEALLFIGGRVQLVEERIRPALVKHQVVVCDRFHDATLAYQGYGSQLDVAWLNQLGRKAIHHMMPHLTLLLDLPAEEGFRRLRRLRDRMERKALAFHRRVRFGYLRLALREPRRFVVVDASQPPREIRTQIKQIVLRRLGLSRLQVCATDTNQVLVKHGVG